MLDKISSPVAAAGPTLPTATPAAWLAKMAASRIDAPAATASVSEAITVSPAPLTSKTSRATVGIWECPFSSRHRQRDLTHVLHRPVEVAAQRSHLGSIDNYVVELRVRLTHFLRFLHLIVNPFPNRDKFSFSGGYPS